MDAYSVREKYGTVKGKKIVIIGDILHSRVALSNIYCLQKLGAKVRVCGPSTLIPKYIDSLGVKHFSNLQEALNWCDVANVLRIQLERQDVKFFPSLREYAMVFGINKDILMSLDKEIIIMHPGPINRGVELTSDVADSGQAIILDQVENGVAIRMAVLYLLAGKLRTMENKIINGHTLVFTLSGNNSLENITITETISNFIADFTDVDIQVLNTIKNNLIKFGSAVSKNKGTFVVVSKYSFDETLNIVPTLQEAQDFIEIEEMERQLNF